MKMSIVKKGKFDKAFLVGIEQGKTISQVKLAYDMGVEIVL